MEPRRVEVSSLAGVEFSLVGTLNHDLPQENKPAEFRKQRKLKQQQGSAEQKLQPQIMLQKNQAESGFSLHRQRKKEALGTA